MKVIPRIFVFILLACALHFGRAQRRGQNMNTKHRAEQDILESILKPENQINPGGNETHSGATVVNVEIYIRNIESLDDQNQELKSQLILRQRWIDPRLIYSQSNNEGLKYVTLEGDVSKVWTPDLFVTNDKSAQLHDFTHTNQYLRIYPNGEVLLSKRVSVTTVCPMSLRYFPLDRQECTLRFASYSYIDQDVAFEWRNNSSSSGPIQVSKTLTLRKFTLESTSVDTCHSQTTTGTYSCIQASLHFRRHFNYYLIHIFIPLTMLIIVAYFSFFISPKEILARIILTTFALGLMVLQVSDFNARTPQTSYTRGVDNFTGISLTFVFLALLETVIVNVLARREASREGEQPAKTTAAGGETGGKVAATKEEKSLIEQQTEAQPEGGEKPPSDVEEGGKPPAKNRRFSPEKYLQRIKWSGLGSSSSSSSTCTSQKIDRVVRIVYPIAFVLFVIVFFAVYASIN